MQRVRDAPSAGRRPVPFGRDRRMSAPPPAPPTADRNLLFGVLALQLDLLDARRFAEACSAWATRKDTPLADLLVERGWLTAADRADVERLLERKLRKQGGDARASLAAE